MGRAKREPIKAQGDYSVKDIKAIMKYRKEHPDVPVWGTMGGLRIPFPLLKISHLQAIIKWIKDNPESYDISTLHMMENVLAEHLAKKGDMGKVLYDKT